MYNKCLHERSKMLTFKYEEDKGKCIEIQYKDYPDYETMCEAFKDFVAARGYDVTDLAYYFDDLEFKAQSLDSLVDGWREKANTNVKKMLETNDLDIDTTKIIEAVIDALVLNDEYYIREKL